MRVYVSLRGSPCGQPRDGADGDDAAGDLPAAAAARLPEEGREGGDGVEAVVGGD